MLPLFLKEKDKKEIRENVQISTLSFLNKTNKTLKQETLNVVQSQCFALPRFHLENFIIFRRLFLLVKVACRVRVTYLKE